jgi:hypothetical protein
MSKKRPTRPKREEYKDENTNEFQNQENFLNENKSKKTNNLVYIVITVLLLIVVGVGTYFFSTITTRSQIKNLDEQVETLNNTIKNKNETINDMSDEIESTTVKEVVPTTSLQRIEGSNIPEFYLIEGDFIAPKTLNIPTLIEDVNDSYLQVGSRFRVVPSKNWLIKSEGATIELSHATKIWGKIKANRHDERVKLEENMKNIIRTFFEDFPSTTIDYRNIYIDDNTVGMMGKALITVTDEESVEKSMVLNVGFAQRGENTLNFMFLHEKENVVGQELVDLLLTGTKYADDNLKLE